VTGLQRWAFKPRFRANAYGWRGSAQAGKRLKEAVSEIKAVAKSDRVLAGEGIVSLIERLWPALQDIDTSSGALGGVIDHTLHELIPILIAAPADVATRSAWLERLFRSYRPVSSRQDKQIVVPMTWPPAGSATHTRWITPRSRSVYCSMSSG
jgi:hypothetical protein